MDRKHGQDEGLAKPVGFREWAEQLEIATLLPFMLVKSPGPRRNCPWSCPRVHVPEPPRAGADRHAAMDIIMTSPSSPTGGPLRPSAYTHGPAPTTHLAFQRRSLAPSLAPDGQITVKIKAMAGMRSALKRAKRHLHKDLPDPGPGAACH